MDIQVLDDGSEVDREFDAIEFAKAARREATIANTLSRALASLRRVQSVFTKDGGLAVDVSVSGGTVYIKDEPVEHSILGGSARLIYAEQALRIAVILEGRARLVAELEETDRALEELALVSAERHACEVIVDALSDRIRDDEESKVSPGWDDDPTVEQNQVLRDIT